LEIGGGHGLYTLDAAEQLSADCRIDVVDISESSLTLAKAILNEIQVQFFHADIFDFEPKYKYDFITIGEVIEHLENPEAMMKRLCNLLTDKGTVFLTTPINAPMIDHIYLFNNAGEIRELIHKTGFKIDKEKLAISEDVTAEEADRLKLPVMYAAFLKKQK
jgi:2-polyprenyl-3-methyl-5-hydroxy-6-metoxy-1,4-benzoquinol methylase